MFIIGITTKNNYGKQSEEDKEHADKIQQVIWIN